MNRNNLLLGAGGAVLRLGAGWGAAADTPGFGASLGRLR